MRDRVNFRRGRRRVGTFRIDVESRGLYPTRPADHLNVLHAIRGRDEEHQSHVLSDKSPVSIGRNGERFAARFVFLN